MYMNVLLNAFSLNMVQGDTMFRTHEVGTSQVPADTQSAIGHESTATVLSAMLGREVAVRRVPITLKPGDVAYVATLFTQDGKPYRPPEGVVLSVSDLSTVVVKIIRVEVLQVGICPTCGRA